MDAIRVSKVERVHYTKSGTTSLGTLHLTTHHLIFRYDDRLGKEMWVPYPLIALVTRLPQTLLGQCPLTFQTRTFEMFSLAFAKEGDATDIFESVKELTVAASITQLYAFFYVPNPPFPNNDGWSLYSPREEFGRMGVGTRSKAWRFSDINRDYSFCPTYPARLVVPTRISDTTLQYASKYRSKCRIPVLSYLHWSNYGSITRSSQPMVGITQNRSVQDEKLIEAVFQSHHSPESRATGAPIYGSTTTNLIIDARPTTNAMANTAKGAGTENMDHYKDSKKVYLGIDHIHVMRESLGKVVEALREADCLLASINDDLSEQVSGISVLDRKALRRSGWLRHISTILEGTLLIARNVHVNSSHILIHCSDGWDRTSQLSALSQLCLDPFYRTIRGFQILVEKDWLSYGHKFLDRCGHLSSDKFFLSPTDPPTTGSGADAAQAFLSSVQNRFASQNHIKETSPVFHQFLESVRQVQRQFPERFEFNERFLCQLYYHLYSCQFGTFLYNCERDRCGGDGGVSPCERTVSLWDFFNSPEEMELNLNPVYDSSLDDPSSRTPNADMGVLFPNPKNVRFWHELYGRTDEEMNGRVTAVRVRATEVVIEGVEGADEDGDIRRSNTPPSPPQTMRPPSPTGTAYNPGNSLGEISTLLPELSSKSESTGTDISRATTQTWPPSSPTPNPQSLITRAHIKQSDFLASSGVKSMWGKLSSNASAALSIMQDAYVGVAKDLRNTSNDGDGTMKSAELLGRDNLSAWGEELSATPQAIASLTSLETSNPWASTRTRQSSHAAFEGNPWGSVRADSMPQYPTLITEDPSSSLPLDPSVARPAPRSLPPSSTLVFSRNSDNYLSNTTALSSSHINQGRSAASSGSTTHTSTTGTTDPLGVGLL